MENNSVDILIPVYKTDNLYDCLKSAAAQASVDTIILLNNTGSDDVSSIAENCPLPVRIISPEKPLSVFNSAMKLADESKAKWVKFLADDDLLNDNAVKNLLDAALSFENISLAFSSYSMIKRNNHKKTLTFDFPEYIKGTDYLFNIYPEITFTTLSGTLIRKDVINGINRQTQGSIRSVCGLVAMHAMIEGDLTYLNTPTVTVRQHAPSIINRQTAENDMYHIIEPLAYYVIKHPQDTKKAEKLKANLLAVYTGDISEEYLMRGHYKEFIRLMKVLYSVCPSSMFKTLAQYRLYKTVTYRMFHRLYRQKSEI